MKNFEVDKILITGEAPVLQSDLGVQPNQIPLNKDLGGLAYMDAPQLEDVNVDTLRLREMTAEISDNAADLFVYDTRKDSDGGKWRERTSHTSWYNEELNTTTRGSRREFPAVAVIVAESGNVKKLKIYDGDDPDLPLWMSFEASGLGSALGRSSSAIFGISSVCMLNGLLCVTGLGSSGNIETLCQISFIDDVFWQWHKYGFGDAGISERNEVHSISTQEYRGRADEPKNVGNYNDVAMTVLPNAPIDADTGLPVPTIAVATDGGVNVIKDDGSVVDSGILQKHERIYFTKDYILITADADSENSDGYRVSDYPLYNNESFRFSRQYRFTQSTPSILSDQKPQDILGFNGHVVGGCSAGLNYFLEDKINNSSGSNVSYGNAAYISSSYNTGWMPGDIKLAALSDTKAEVIGGLGEELITNGTFDTDVSGWTLIDPTTNPDATITWNNGVAEIFRPVDQGARFYQGFNTVIGREYVVSAGVNVGGYYIADGIDTSSWNIIANDGAVILDTSAHRFFAASSVTYFILNSTTENISHPFDNISVKQTGELITNGTFDNGTTGWTLGNGWSIANGTATWDGAYFTTIQPTTSIGLINGKRYTYIIETTGIGGVNIYYNGVNNYHTLSGGGLFSATFTAGDDSNISIGTSFSGATVDNISVRLAEDDRSVNNNGLQVFGEIDKTPVAPGADLVAYSGFSADNYLMQPYNPDLDFGTGDFSIMGWFKQSPTTNFHTYFDRGNLIVVYIDEATSKLNFRITDGTTYMNCLSANAVDNDTWTFFVGVKSNDITYNYINGKLEQTASYTTVGSLDGDFDSYFGVSVDGLRHGDKMALWRVSATIPTDDQIAKIYRDEKVLFTDGAQATLYGTSDAVTALAYDDKTELLHVGTASGRSDFAGLRRINNTTTAVTTSISASNNLIAEQ